MHVARLTYDFVGPVPSGDAAGSRRAVSARADGLQLVEADLVARTRRRRAAARDAAAPERDLRLPIGADGRGRSPAARPETAERSDFPLEPPDAEGLSPHRDGDPVRAGTSYGAGRA
jgi:hypothetical protein